MFAYIGKYPDYISVYKIADFLEHFCVVNRDRKAIGSWLAKTWVDRFCKWYNNNKCKRTVIIKPHHYDHWNASETMAMLVLPILKDLRLHKHGAGFVADEDVPEHLRSTNAPPKENEWDTDELWFDRFDWVLDEIIWALENTIDTSWENQFYTGESDYKWIPCEDGFCEMTEGPNHTLVFDKDGWKAYHDRVNNGLRLLGTYFNSMWD